MYYRPRCLILNTYTPYASIYTMGQDILAAVRELGFSATESLQGNYTDPKLFEAMMLMMGQFQGKGFVFEFNGRNNQKVINPKVGQKSLYDEWKLPKVCWLTDNPSHHMENLCNLPDYSILGVVDRDFLDWLPSCGLSTRRTFFMPHAGPPPLPQQALTAERELDVLFFGNIVKVPTASDWANSIVGDNPDRQRCLLQAIDCCLQTDKGFFETLSTVFDDADMELSLTEKLYFVSKLEAYVIARRRLDILSGIKRSRVTVFGNVDPAVQAQFGPNIVFRNTATFEDFQDFAMNAKIVLNLSTSFRNGAHERVFYGLSRGAHILTERSRFLAQEVSADLGISFLDFDAMQADDAIERVLDLGNSLDDQRERALTHYAGNHLWKNRIEDALDILEQEYWNT